MVQRLHTKYCCAKDVVSRVVATGVTVWARFNHFSLNLKNNSLHHRHDNAVRIYKIDLLDDAILDVYVSVIHTVIVDDSSIFYKQSVLRALQQINTLLYT